MTQDPFILKWATVWLVAALFALARHWRSEKGVGILFTYVLSFGMLHWIAPVLYLLPWYDTPHRALTGEGLKQSAIGMLALAAGVEAAAWALNKWRRQGPQTPPARLRIDSRFARLYLVAGVVIYGVVSPVARSLPSIGRWSQQARR